MKTKSVAPKEDPETKARREVEEARAESDRTSATQRLLDRKSRRVLRVFGARAAGPAAGGFAGASGAGGGGSGASGVPYVPFTGGFTGGTDFGNIAY